MIFRIIKAIFNLAFSFFLILALVITFFVMRHRWIKASEPDFNSVSEMVMAYEKTEQAQVGEWSLCPVCRNYYYKTENFVCCSQECEDEYWDILSAYEIGSEHQHEMEKSKTFVENHGKHFK